MLFPTKPRTCGRAQVLKFVPQHPDIQRHVDHFWIVENAQFVFVQSPPLHEFPGLSPEFILVLDGSYTISYQGKRERVFTNKLYSFIDRDVLLDLSMLRSFAIIRFQPRNLSSLLPFIRQRADEVMRNPVFPAEAVFTKRINLLTNHLRGASATTIAAELEGFLLDHFLAEREGFLSELSLELPAGGSPKEIMAQTNYSYSTLERNFKRDTGLTPKKFQTLRRFRRAVNELYDTGNTDWLHYVEKYGYYDQSHFIKEVKRYSNLTPSQILTYPGLRPYRPKE